MITVQTVDTLRAAIADAATREQTAWDRSRDMSLSFGARSAATRRSEAYRNQVRTLQDALIAVINSRV